MTLFRQMTVLISASFRSALVMLVAIGSFCAVIGAWVPAYRLNGLWIGQSQDRVWVDGALVLLAIALVAMRMGVHRRPSRIAAGALVALLATVAVVDALTYYELLGAGSITSDAPVPLSLGLALLFTFGAWHLSRGHVPRRTPLLARCAAVAFVPFLLLAHLDTLGATDYRRPADAAIVFGAAVRPDGEASGALHDRILSAVDLYKQGFVGTLVLSGGRDPAAPWSEPACMAHIAMMHGVPPTALLLDETGLTTRATMDEAKRLSDRHGWSRLLFVSHDYHLARIQVGAKRRGLTPFTVPARELRHPYWKPPAILREVAALGWYLATDL